MILKDRILDYLCEGRGIRLLIAACVGLFLAHGFIYILFNVIL